MSLHMLCSQLGHTFNNTFTMYTVKIPHVCQYFMSTRECNTSAWLDQYSVWESNYNIETLKNNTDGNIISKNFIKEYKI